MNFPVQNEFIELFKLLKAANLVSSGGEGKHVVAEGLVKVDGLLETGKRRKIRAGQRIEFAGETIVVVSPDDLASSR